MKNGKKPTYNQRKQIERSGLDAHDWLVIKDTSTELVVVNRDNSKTVLTLRKDD